VSNGFDGEYLSERQGEEEGGWKGEGAEYVLL